MLARGAARPARRARVLAARERDVRDLVGRARRCSARRRARALARSRARALRTAVLLHDPALLERQISLRDILAAAALSVEIARLRVEVRLQLQEVQASRVRIVEAGYEERRRLERDLHDGAQQRLVSLGLHIRRMQRSLPSEARILAPALDQIVGEVGSAITRSPADRGRRAAGAPRRRAGGGAARPGSHDADPGRGRGADRAGVRERGGRGLLRRLRGAHQRGQARVRVARRAVARCARTARSR